MNEKTLIVGAGQAGSHAAMALRKAGYKGEVTLVGDEIELPYERPPLSKEMLYRDGAADGATYFHPPGRYAEMDVGVLCGVGVEVIQPASRTILLQDGRTLRYTNLLLTTGSRPRRVAVPGGDRIHYLRTLEDARLLRDKLRQGTSVVCIGAGVIGLEIASSAQARGCSVTVVEAAARPMSRSLSGEVADWLTAWHERNGVRFLFETAVAEVRAGSVLTQQGMCIPADVVVAGIGIERNTELATAAGVEVDDGILVDEYGKSSVEGIYAAGDVAAFWSRQYGQYVRQENWQHAQDHGVAVGQSLAGKAAAYDCTPWFWSDQHGVNLQMAGTLAGSASSVVRGSIGDGPPFSVWAFDANDMLTGVIGIDAPRDVRAGKMVIRDGKWVDPALVADPSLSLQSLVRQAEAAPRDRQAGGS